MILFSRRFLCHRLLDLSALFCFRCLYLWIWCSSSLLRSLPDEYPLWRQEVMFRYDRGDWHARFVAHEMELFPRFIPRGFRCTYYDDRFPLRLMRATDGRTSQWLIAIPVFPLFLFSATLLIMRGRRTMRADWQRWTAWHRERRQRHEAYLQGRSQKICRHCGYDLRATSCRCPECGTVPLGLEPLDRH